MINDYHCLPGVPGVAGVCQEGDPGAGVDADDAARGGVRAALRDILAAPVSSRHGGDSAPEQIIVGNSYCGTEIQIIFLLLGRTDREPNHLKRLKSLSFTRRKV